MHYIKYGADMMRPLQKPKKEEKPYKIREGPLKELATQKIIQLILEKKLKGPFNREDLRDDIYVSSVFVKEKDLSRKKILLLVDYSSPKGDSINSAILPRYTYVALPKIQFFILLCLQIGKGAMMSVQDLKNAYYNVAIMKEYQRLFGFSWEGKILFPAYMPFGVATGCRTLQKLLDIVNLALRILFPQIFTLNGRPTSHHYLDDEAHVAINSTQAWLQCTLYILLVTIIGFPIDIAKVQFPSFHVTLLGFELNLLSFELSLKSNKATQYLKLILIELDYPSRAELHKSLKILGRLRHAAKAIHGAAAFVRQLELQIVSLQASDYPSRKFYTYTDGALNDLRFWKILLPKFNGIPFNYVVQSKGTFDLSLFTDASGNPELGFGAWDTFGNFCLINWSTTILNNHPLLSENRNNVLEFVAMVVTIIALRNKYKNKAIHAFSDNSTAVTWLIKKSPKFKIKYYHFVAFLLRTLMLTCIDSRIFIWFDFLPREFNKRADGLSNLRRDALKIIHVKPKINEPLKFSSFNPRSILKKLVSRARTEKFFV